MMNKQLAFVKSGLGLALCFLMVGAGVTPAHPINQGENSLIL